MPVSQVLQTAISNGNFDAITLHNLCDETTLSNINNETFITNWKDALVFAATGNHLNAVPALLEINPHETKLEQAFLLSLETNHTNLFNHLLEMHQVVNPLRVIHTLCSIAVNEGNLTALNHGLTLLPEDQHQLVIHTEFNENPDDDEIIVSDPLFNSAAEKGHLHILKRLVELTPNPSQCHAMLHSRDNNPFKRAAGNGHVDIVNYIIKQTSKTIDPTATPLMKSERQLMIDARHTILFNNFGDPNSHPTYTINPISLQTESYLAVNGLDAVKSKKPLNPNVISTLSTLQKSLTQTFSKNTDKNTSQALASSVIATLLSGNNLSTKAQDLGNLRASSSQGVSLIKTSSKSNETGTPLIPELQDNVSQFLTKDIIFSDLSPKQQEIANFEIRQIFKPQPKLKIATATHLAPAQEKQHN